MFAKEETCDRLKAGYLRQVEKVLSSVKSPRVKQVIEDIRLHLDQRFAELEPGRRSAENLQAIITEMGSPSDYAELLASDIAPPSWKAWRKYLLGAGSAAIIIVAAILLTTTVSWQAQPVTPEQFRRGFPEKIVKLNIDTAKPDDVIRIFGEPIAYVWGQRTIEKNKIPTDQYCVNYPDDFSIYMNWGKVVELRFSSHTADYAFRDKIRVGSSLDEVLEVVGQPTETVEGEPIGWFDSVLYKDIEGTKGRCYYHRSDQNVRFFFLNYKVSGMHITRSDYNGVN
jgi:hypothetical protein